MCEKETEHEKLEHQAASCPGGRVYRAARGYVPGNVREEPECTGVLLSRTRKYCPVAAALWIESLPVFKQRQLCEECCTATAGQPHAHPDAACPIPRGYGHLCPGGHVY